MFSSQVRLSLIFVTISLIADAIPLTRQSGMATLDFTRRINELPEGMTIAGIDRARAQAMKNVAQPRKRQQSTVDISNNFFIYTAEVGVGEPATTYSLVIDTGSSNTFVGAGKPFVPSSTSYDTGQRVYVSYGSGSFSGEEWLDTVTLSPSMVIMNQSIGVATYAVGFKGVDGILGVGPVDLTVDTLTPDRTTAIPTVMDNLYNQRTIQEEVLGVYFIPAPETNAPGQLTFGGYDASVIWPGVPNYVPLTTTFPASKYWGIDQSVTYGGTTLLSTTAGIVDTGATLVLLATDAFQQYQKLTGGVMDGTTGLLSITPEQYDFLQPLVFNIGGLQYPLMPDAQIWPRSLNNKIKGAADGIYLIVGDIRDPSGSGLDFMNGYSFLERYYSVYDTTNNRVGFAATGYTLADVNYF